MFFLVFLLSAACAQTISSPIVNTTEGNVQGAISADQTYYVYYGIPYAGSVSGANRFKAPTPALAREGLFQATDQNIYCAHPTSRGIVGIEDCLVLNIHTKNVTTPKPVLVFVQGEEYTSIDTRTFSFKRLVDADFVVISINYRLSVFGFLCLGVPEAPGNAGLKDIVQGLKWIKDNVAGFGGDPNNVILFGHGSGAAMVDLVTLSPLATNLVHKAITQSGSALAPWAVAYEPVKYAEAFGAVLSYTGKSRQELAQKLVGTDITLLGNALNEFELLNNTALFAPCIENKNLNLNESFLTDAPINILRSGNYSHIPYFSGYTDREGTIRAAQASSWIEKMEANFTRFLPVDLSIASVENNSAIVNSIKSFYFEQSPVSMATITDYLDFHGDTMILVSVIRGVRERSLTSTAEVRLMEFTYRGTYNSDWVYQQIPLDGVRHGGVLNYLFDFDLKVDDETIMKSLIARYKAFADTGVPTNVNLRQTTWPAITPGALNYLYYAGGEGPSPGTSVSTESSRLDPHSQRMNFWNNLYAQYYVAPTQASSSEKVLGVALVVLLSQFCLGIF